MKSCNLEKIDIGRCRIEQMKMAVSNKSVNFKNRKLENEITSVLYEF